MTSSSCAGDCPRTLHQLGTSQWSIAVGVWYQEEHPEAGLEGGWQLLAGVGSDWMKWVGPALSLTGWRWTACTCCGWEAATRRATGSTVRRCTFTPRLHQVRVHADIFWLSSLTSKQILTLSKGNCTMCGKTNTPWFMIMIHTCTTWNREKAEWK